MTVPGVGPIVALSYRTVLIFRGASPSRAKCLSTSASHRPNMPPGKQTAPAASPSAANAEVRSLLYEGAMTLLTRVQRWSWLKRWGMEVAKRRGLKRACVAVARKLAIILHRIWTDVTEFRWSREAVTA